MTGRATSIDLTGRRRVVISRIVAAEISRLRRELAIAEGLEDGTAESATTRETREDLRVLDGIARTLGIPTSEEPQA